MENNDYYGAPVNNDIKPLGERLRDYYEPSDFVTVINIDTEPLKYQFMDPKNEQFISTAPYHGETRHIAPPTVVILQPGETKLCPAFEADMMITTLIKKLATRRVHQQISSGEVVKSQGADWTDPTFQIDMIGKILLGKEDLIGKYNEALKAPSVTDASSATTAAVANDLEVADAPVERPRRRRTSPAI